MGSGGGGGTQTTIQKTDPPAYVQPFATDYLHRASGLSNTPFQAYTGDFSGLNSLGGLNTPQGPAPTKAQFTKTIPATPGTPGYAQPDRGGTMVGGTPGTPASTSFDEAGYQSALDKYNQSGQSGPPFDPQTYLNARIAPLNAQQEQGLTLTEQRALAGSPVLNSAKQNLMDTLNGNYLTPDSNPFLKGAVDSALRDVQSRVNTQFAGNNYGGTAQQEWLGTQLADTALPIYAQNYDAERNRQMQANLFAPQMAQSDYTDLQALLGVGDTRQAQSQQQKDVLYDLWNQMQQYPYQQNDYLGQAVAGSPGMQSMTSGPNPYQQNKTANALGLAAAGAGIGSIGSGTAAGATFGPYGALIGGGIGLLGGLLS